MKKTNLNIQLIIILLLVLNQSLFAQENVEQIERSIPYIQDQDLYFEIDYVDKIDVSYWEENTIEITALVDLRDAKGNNINEKFALDIENKNGQHNIIAKVLNQTAHYVLKKSGSDYKPRGAFSDKVLVVGTTINLKIPKGVNLEFKGASMGDITIDHNGAGLLAATSGNITLYIDKNIDADLKLSSLFGDILVDNTLKISQNNSNDGLKKLSSREDLEYKLNNGGNVIISFSAYGNVKILPKE